MFRLRRWLATKLVKSFGLKFLWKVWQEDALSSRLFIRLPEGLRRIYSMGVFWLFRGLTLMVAFVVIYVNLLVCSWLGFGFGSRVR